MPKTIDSEKAKVIVAFLEANVRPRLEKIINEVNTYLSKKHNVQIGADLDWLMHELTESDNNDKKS